MIPKRYLLILLLITVLMLGFAAYKYFGENNTSPLTSGVLKKVYEGCRSPSEPGCSECMNNYGAECDISYFEGRGVSGHVEPSYNASRVGSCTSGIPKCASCLKTTEKELKELQNSNDFKKCSCNSIDISKLPNDVCFGPFDCDCLCSRYKGLSEACGQKE